MREYSMPPDIRDKEKIFGGIFTMTQFIFLAGGIIIGIALGLFLYQIIPSIIFVIVGIVLGSCLGVPFAFVKIRALGDMELARFLFLKYQFKHKPKQKIHVNENYQKYIGGI